MIVQFLQWIFEEDLKNFFPGWVAPRVRVAHIFLLRNLIKYHVIFDIDTILFLYYTHKIFQRGNKFSPDPDPGFFARGPLSRSPASAAAGPDLNLNFTNNSFFSYNSIYIEYT